MGNYDYIIIGGGASGLQLADAMGRDPWFSDKRIALLEEEPQKGNDRTWCFWEAGPGPFDALASNQWGRIEVAGPGFRTKLSIGPLRYKMIRGADFYSEYYGRLQEHTNIDILRETVYSLSETERGARLDTSAGPVEAALVFSSVSFADPPVPDQPYPLIRQHFIGWRVRTAQPVFDPETPVFMDFDIPQLGNTRFMYILPEGHSEALVEYTLFSEDLLEREAYEAALDNYLRNNLGTGYEILDREQGSIPMTCNDFTAADSRHIVHIGIAGGWARPSTGYTFWNCSRKVPDLIQALKSGNALQMARRDRYWFYDLVLLEVLAGENRNGHRVFTELFRRRPADQILRFLHQQTSLAEDLNIIAACPKGMFLRALWRSLVKSLN